MSRGGGRQGGARLKRGPGRACEARLGGTLEHMMECPRPDCERYYWISVGQQCPVCIGMAFRSNQTRLPNKAGPRASPLYLTVYRFA